MTSSTTSSTLSHSLPTLPFASKLSEQLSQRQEQSDSGAETETAGDKNNSLGPPLRPSPKSRSLSDAAKPVSSPRSNASDENRPSSKDDTSLSSTPETPQRLSMYPGLPLNTTSSSKPSAPSPLSSNRTPLSPKLDSSQIYSSPGSVLPRRSRGLDFSRACTNLHHSTLAESSPDSSPTIGGRGMNIPPRRGSIGSTSAPFSTSGPADKTTISSSVSSVNMMESDTSSSEEDDESMEKDDLMITSTPQANKFAGGPSPFAGGNVPSPGNDWMGGYSQAAASLMSFQRARFRKGRSRHSSSSASGNSSKPSPSPHSPPVMKSIENQNNGGYFAAKAGVGPRRESLSLGTRDLRLSDLSDDESRTRGHSPGTPSSEGGPLGVIRRAVTRRGSLLPKTKTFARIRAALMEETAPIDSEAKRESEVIRQVRESEPEISQKSPGLDAFSSGNPFQPAEPFRNAGDTSKMGTSAPEEPSFSEEAHRNSAGQEFWDSFDERYRTPPPPLRRPGTSVSEDDQAMDITPSTAVRSSGHEFAKPGERPSSRSSTPFVPHSGTITEFKRKRQREDDFDTNLFKRRAVSPSMSVQSSPVMPNSPVVKDPGPNIWGPPPKSNLGALFPDRAPETPGRGNSSHGGHTGTLKRVGLQGMTETNDGLMNMSIE